MHPFAYFALACAGLFVTGLIVAIVQKIRGEDTEGGCALSGCAVFLLLGVMFLIEFSERGCSVSGPGGGRGIPSGPPPAPPAVPKLY